MATASVLVFVFGVPRLFSDHRATERDVVPRAPIYFGCVNEKVYSSGSVTSSSTVSQKREENGDEWLTGSTIPTTLERTLAPGIALLIVASLLLVCSYLLLLFLV